MLCWELCSEALNEMRCCHLWIYCTSSTPITVKWFLCCYLRKSVSKMLKLQKKNIKITDTSLNAADWQMQWNKCVWMISSSTFKSQTIRLNEIFQFWVVSMCFVFVVKAFDITTMSMTMMMTKMMMQKYAQV